MLNQQISILRRSAGYTQEELANILNISRQAVQKWESGTARPDLERLIAMSELFDISLDELVGAKTLCTDSEELRFSRKILPNYALIPDWELYSANLKIEFRQLQEEGHNIEPLRKLVHEISLLPACETRESFAELAFSLMRESEIRSDYPYTEPSELSEIRTLRKALVNVPVKNTEYRATEDQVRGAWLGRIAGCLLGKPIEGIKTPELNLFLKETGNFPLNRYITAEEVTNEISAKFEYRFAERCYPSTIAAAPSDDDTNYTVMSAAKLIEVYGRDFQPGDVAKCWMDNQPKNAYCTAERVAFVNFINGYYPPFSAIHKNPFREWIGAQIRGDYFGYINPGNPEAAAEMAWRDACVSHVKNGIYGEMLVAAMLAFAAVCDDVKTVILGGLSEIPSTSRLYKQINELIAFHEKKPEADACIEWIHGHFDENDPHDWCHTISNALIVITALLTGGGDFERSVCTAVQAGFDTDCNGATVGSIIGMMRGAGNIPEKWTKPFGLRLKTSLYGLEEVSVDELVELTLKHIV